MNNSRTLAQLSEESGLPARTIRFYIARGLLDGRYFQPDSGATKLPSVLCAILPFHRTINVSTFEGEK